MRVFAILLLSCSLSCASVVSNPAAPDRFSFLQKRQLSDFERALASDAHNGEETDWTKLGNSWLAFANCEPFPDVNFEDRSISFLEASLRSESARRDMRLIIFASDDAPVETLAGTLMSESFFNRKGIDEDAIKWPGGTERWADEHPASLDIQSRCSEYITEVANKALDLDKDGLRTPLEYWEARYYNSIIVANKMSKDIPFEKRRGAIGETLFKINLEGIRYFAGRRRIFEQESQSLKKQRNENSKSPDEDADLLRLQTLGMNYVSAFSKKIKILADNLQELVPVEGLRFSATELAIAKSVLAMLALEDGRFEDARNYLISKPGSVPDFDDTQSAWLSRYLDIRVNSALGNFKYISAKYDNALPPRRSKYYGPYVYRLAIALKEGGTKDRFYGVVKSAFRDRVYKSDPFLRALYFELLKSLAAVPFGPEVSEMLEELGLRGETFERVEELARVALDEGHPDNASAAAKWLLSNHNNAKFHPRYNAITALSAFQSDDEALFLAALKAVIYRQKEVVEALAPSRRAKFFQHADIELTRVLQRIIPEMAEWGDSAMIRKRRQKWLKVLVGVTQEFLHNDKNSMARRALVELYRLASGLLEDDPRGYAERVGESRLRPLVLGQVTLESTELDAFEPGIDLGISTVFSTTLVPNNTPIAEWMDRFPEGEVYDD